MSFAAVSITCIQGPSCGNNGYGWQSTVRAAFIEEFRDFLRLTQGESSPCADGKSRVWRAVEIAQAVYQSNAERRPVSVGTAE